MHAALQLLAEVAAASPPPAPPLVGPALPAPSHVGPVGEWFLPAVIIGIAIALDATKGGAAAKRDRVAVALTYAGTLGLISVYGWAHTIQGWVGDTWSWRITGSAIAFAVHVCLAVVLVGPWVEKVQRQSAWLSAKVGVGGGSSSGGTTSRSATTGRTAPASGGAVGKLNTKLHLWAVAAACTYVLARGDAARFPELVGTVLTGISGAIGMWVVARFGG